MCSFLLLHNESAMQQKMADNVIAKMSTLHSIVIGPGLGRDNAIVSKALHIIMKQAEKQKLPMVIDAG
jgi:NAD(P)H-hydrate repair Nnr-like enzyme with NAD(P)H-hydrate dehydratase domain